MFVVTIRNTKSWEEMRFHANDPMLKYRQNSPNNCCFGSLTPAFEIINQTKDANTTTKRIYE